MEWATTINVEELFKDDTDASSGGVEDWQLFIQRLRQGCNLCNTLWLRLGRGIVESQ